MANYKTEFKDFPAADMPAIPQGFADSSWRNDSCPSMISEELGLRIWIDYAQVEMREHADDGHRFVLQPDNNEDDVTEHVCTDDWAVILAAIEEERAEIGACLDQLAKADGAILHWQLDDKKFAVMEKRGLIRMEGDCYVHPKARKLSELAFTMAQHADMRVLYACDNEGPVIMLLNQLIANFDANGGWQYRASAEGMREELESRGWFEGMHINGRYLVLSLDKMHLEPHPDHPANQL